MDIEGIRVAMEIKIGEAAIDFVSYIYLVPVVGQVIQININLTEALQDFDPDFLEELEQASKCTHFRCTERNDIYEHKTGLTIPGLRFVGVPDYNQFQNPN